MAEVRATEDEVLEHLGREVGPHDDADGNVAETEPAARERHQQAPHQHDRHNSDRDVAQPARHRLAAGDPVAKVVERELVEPLTGRRSDEDHVDRGERDDASRRDDERTARGWPVARRHRRRTAAG
jgi:hypothetical protein